MSNSLRISTFGPLMSRASTVANGLSFVRDGLGLGILVDRERRIDRDQIIDAADLEAVAGIMDRTLFTQLCPVDRNTAAP